MWVPGTMYLQARCSVFTHDEAGWACEMTGEGENVLVRAAQTQGSSSRRSELLAESPPCSAVLALGWVLFIRDISSTLTSTTYAGTQTRDCPFPDPRLYPGALEMEP